MKYISNDVEKATREEDVRYIVVYCFLSCIYKKAMIPATAAIDKFQELYI